MKSPKNLDEITKKIELKTILDEITKKFELKISWMKLPNCG